MRAPVSAILCAASLLGGCFLDRSALAPDPTGQDSGSPPRVDAGPHDAGAPRDDAGEDPTDAGPPCTSADEGCDGETARVCEPTGLRTIDCLAMGAFCEAGSCVPQDCAPSTTACTADGTGVVSCDARGRAIEPPVACERGCESGMCRPATPCTAEIAGTLVDGGTLRVDLCGGGNHSRSLNGDGCFLEENGQDRVVRLELNRPGRFRIELADEDDAYIDPAVYVRTACEDRSSELGCANGGVEWSVDARFEIDLPAGDVFVILDSLEYGGSCGDVELTVTRL